MTAGPPARPLAPDPVRSRLAGPGALVLLTAAVAAFSGGWPGRLVLEGPGASLYLRLLIDHAGHGYWFPEMWAGSPLFAAVPSFPILAVLPLARLVGTDTSVKLAVLAFQVLGAWGAYVLARSLWERTAPALVAGLVYGLHPLFVSHGVLLGAETTAGLLACLPWLAWSLRRGLRGDGTTFVVLAGLLVAFAVLHEPDCTYAVALLCQCLLSVELGRVRGGLSAATHGQVLGRAAAVVGIGLGAVAHWLLPFVALSKWFVASPRAAVPGDVFAQVGELVQGDLGVFVRRPAPLSATIGLVPHEVSSRLFYLGGVCLVLTIVSVVLLPRADVDGTLTAILTAAGVGLWVCTAAVPLARSGMALRGQWLPLVVAGAVTGLLLGAYLLHLHLGRAAPWAWGVTLAVIVAMPFVTPFLTLHRLLPVFVNFNFPRFYLLAPLALALGTGLPVLLLERRLLRLRPSLVAPAVAVLVGVVGAAVLVDVWPARSFYRVGPAQETALGTLDPAAVGAAIQRRGRTVEGWPLRTAGRRLARLTVEAGRGPAGYRDAALAVAGAGALPVVRAYDRAVVLSDATLAPELALALAARNVGVVTGPAGATAGLPVTAVDAHGQCGLRSAPPVAGELAMACATHRWAGELLGGIGHVPVDQGPGAVLTATAGGLRGFSVWLDGPADEAGLTLYDMADDGLALGREVARTHAIGTDGYGLTLFPFDPVPDSAGRRYAFRLDCANCGDGLTGVTVAARGSDGGLIVGTELHDGRALAFTPVYDRLPAAPPATTTVRGGMPRAGEWRIETSGSGPALVVVAEARFPGWRARVDGKAVKVLSADGAFMGVVVPAGDHRVTLDYRRPAVSDVGRLITAATLGVLVLVPVLGRRRRRQR